MADAFDITQAHKHFSAACFNQTWALMEKPTRTDAENEQMVLCALASLWHWTQRSDVTPQNLSVGHWQVSRAQALAGHGETAMQHARKSLEYSEDLEPFYVGYAHEAMARAATVLRDRSKFQAHLQEARACALNVSDADERDALNKDLKALSGYNVW